MTPTHALVRESQDVAEAARQAWETLGEETQVRPWADVAQALGLDAHEGVASVVVVPRLRRMECVVNIRERLEFLREQLSRLAMEGWDVTALLPVNELGQAHEILGGVAVHLQGWWPREDGRLCFTSTETA